MHLGTCKIRLDGLVYIFREWNPVDTAELKFSSESMPASCTIGPLVPTAHLPGALNWPRLSLSGPAGRLPNARKPAGVPFPHPSIRRLFYAGRLTSNQGVAPQPNSGKERGSPGGTA